MSNQFDPNNPTPFDEAFNRVAAATGLPVNYLKSVAQVESKMDPSAVSGDGAQGLMQLTPPAVQDIGGNWEDVKNNPEANIQAGAQYIKPLYEQYGPYAAWAAYNMGPSRFANDMGGKIENIPADFDPQTMQGIGRLQQAYPQGTAAEGAPSGEYPVAAQPQQYRDPFNPNANMELPAQPIYGQAEQPQGNYPQNPMGGVQSGGTGPASPNGPSGPAGPQIQRPQEEQLDPALQAQGQEQTEAPQATDGTINIPAPETNPGFWETLRMAAQNDPATFYMVLADLAQLNLPGIKATMQQREENLMSRAKLQAETAKDYRDESRKNIDKIRYRGMMEPYLNEWESEHGVIDTEEEAEAFQAFTSDKKAGAQKDKDFKDALGNIGKMLASGLKSGVLPKSRKMFETVYQEDADQAIAFMEERIKESKELAGMKKDELDLKIQLMRQRLEEAKKTDLDPTIAANIRAKMNLAARRIQVLTQQVLEANLFLSIDPEGGFGKYSPEQLSQWEDQLAEEEQRLADAKEQLDPYAYSDAGDVEERQTGDVDMGTYTDISGVLTEVQKEQKERMNKNKEGK